VSEVPDLQRRLDRRFAGESLLGLPSLVLELTRRDRPAERPPILPSRGGEAPRVREVRPPVSPSPNAPLLIRVVKFPFALSPGRPGRTPLPEAAAAPDRARPGLPRRERLGAVAGVPGPLPRPRPAAPRPPRGLVDLLLEVSA